MTRSSCSRPADNLTFDGSLIRGFSRQQESDLRLAVDWPTFYWLPSDIFGPGKVLAFGEVRERDGSPYGASTKCQASTPALEVSASALRRRMRQLGME